MAFENHDDGMDLEELMREDVFPVTELNPMEGEMDTLDEGMGTVRDNLSGLQDIRESNGHGELDLAKNSGDLVEGLRTDCRGVIDAERDLVAAAAEFSAHEAAAAIDLDISLSLGSSVADERPDDVRVLSSMLETKDMELQKLKRSIAKLKDRNKNAKSLLELYKKGKEEIVALTKQLGEKDCERQKMEETFDETVKELQTLRVRFREVLSQRNAAEERLKKLHRGSEHKENDNATLEMLVKDLSAQRDDAIKRVDELEVEIQALMTKSRQQDERLKKTESLLATQQTILSDKKAMENRREREQIDAEYCSSEPSSPAESTRKRERGLRTGGEGTLLELKRARNSSLHEEKADGVYVGIDGEKLVQKEILQGQRKEIGSVCEEERKRLHGNDTDGFGKREEVGDVDRMDLREEVPSRYVGRGENLLNATVAFCLSDSLQQDENGQQRIWNSVLAVLRERKEAKLDVDPLVNDILSFLSEAIQSRGSRCVEDAVLALSLLTRTKGFAWTYGTLLREKLWRALHGAVDEPTVFASLIATIGTTATSMADLEDPRGKHAVRFVVGKLQALANDRDCDTVVREESFRVSRNLQLL